MAVAHRSMWRSEAAPGRIRLGGRELDGHPGRAGTNGAFVDAALYAGSALVAGLVPLTTDVPLDRSWARIAVPGYAVGALVALVVARTRPTILRRAALAASVFAAVAVVPLVVHAGSRLGPGIAHVKSDVLVVERAAGALVEGHNPYDRTLDGGGLGSWSLATRSHVPYLPGTLVAGLPSAVVGPAVWTDARVVDLALALAIALPALAWSRARANARLRAFQVLFVLASGAPLVFSSGKEPLVLALLLVSLVALDRRREAIAGLAAGTAAVAFQLAWVVVAVLVLGSRGRERARAISIGVMVVLAVVTPFVVLDPVAMVEDVVLFPLGFGQPDPSAAITPGSAIAAVGSEARWAIVIVLAGVALAAGIALAHRRPATIGEAARIVGALLALALLLAPRIRLAYLAFPLNLVVWSRTVLAGSEPPRVVSVRSAPGSYQDEEPAGAAMPAGDAH